MCRTSQGKRGVRTVVGHVTAVLGGGLLLAAGLAGAMPALPASQSRDLNAHTIAALADVQTAIAELQKSTDPGLAGGAGLLKSNAQRVINDLVGTADPRYEKNADMGDDALGALGHIDHVLHDSESEPWVAPVTTASVNVQAAVGGLQNAINDDELQSFLIDASDALTHLDVAVGRTSDAGVLGGLRGALANTVLGIPPHSHVISGCDEPSAVPAFGVKDGYVVYVAVPVSGGNVSLPDYFSSNQLEVSGKRLVAYTAAAQIRNQLCARHQASASGIERHAPLNLAAAAGFVRIADPPVPVNSPQSKTRSTKLVKASGADKPATSKSTSGHDHALPVLYTAKQAKAGKRIFENKCVTCHGAHLQGKSAPSVAGKDFLQVANRNGWTLGDLRNIVVYNMPFNDPGTLSKHQYADVIAYLLASNCYPSGDKPFPADGSDGLASLRVESPDKMHPTDAKLGVCRVN
ncbi:MAG: cytochrome c [Burkholderiales bacterium]